LGELNKEGFNKDTLKSDLYVNLRCMKIIKIRRICIWAAALQNSNPRKEWEESVNKSMTMKRVL
jgi:isochorismate synthase